MTMPAKRHWLDYLPLIGLAFTIAAGIWAGSQYAAKIDDNTRRLVIVETKQDGLQQLDVRLARIEAKLEDMDQRVRRP